MKFLRIVARSLLVVALGSLASPVHAQAADDTDRIIVSGASGNLGRLTVRALLDRGVPASRLILVSRTPESLAEYAAMGADTRFGDFTVPDSLPAAYAGGKRMLLISIGGGNLPESRPVLHKRAIDAAIAAGVEQIAYTSWAAISQGETSGVSADHLATEEILAASDVAYTILRNSVYMDGIPAQAADMVAAGRAVVPPGESRMSYVTRADCAEAAAAVLSSPGHEDTIYDITGPELVGTREIAVAAREVTGSDIDVVEGEPGSARGFGAAGLDFVSMDFERLTGRRATSIRQLLEANRDAL